MTANDHGKSQRIALIIVVLIGVVAGAGLVAGLVGTEQPSESPKEQARHLKIPGALTKIGAGMADAGPRVVLNQSEFRVAPNASLMIPVSPASANATPSRRGTFALPGGVHARIVYADLTSDHAFADLRSQSFEYPVFGDDSGTHTRVDGSVAGTIIATPAGGTVTLTCGDHVLCVFEFR